MFQNKNTKEELATMLIITFRNIWKTWCLSGVLLAFIMPVLYGDTLNQTFQTVWKRKLVSLFAFTACYFWLFTTSVVFNFEKVCVPPALYKHGNSKSLKLYRDFKPLTVRHQNPSSRKWKFVYVLYNKRMKINWNTLLTMSLTCRTFKLRCLATEIINLFRNNTSASASIFHRRLRLLKLFTSLSHNVQIS